MDTLMTFLKKWIKRKNDICPKCSNILDTEGICWKCLEQSNK